MPTVMQGTAIVDAGLEMTVEGTTMRNTVGPTDFYGPWVIVMVLVVNYSDKPAYFNPMIQELLVNGDEFEPNPAVAESLDSETVSSASLLPRRRRQRRPGIFHRQRRDGFHQASWSTCRPRES